MHSMCRIPAKESLSQGNLLFDTRITTFHVTVAPLYVVLFNGFSSDLSFLHVGNLAFVNSVLGIALQMYPLEITDTLSKSYNWKSFAYMRALHMLPFSSF